MANFTLDLLDKTLPLICQLVACRATIYPPCNQKGREGLFFINFFYSESIYLVITFIEPICLLVISLVYTKVLF